MALRQHLIQYSVFLPDKVPAGYPDKKEATTTEVIMYIPGNPSINLYAVVLSEHEMVSHCSYVVCAASQATETEINREAQITAQFDIILRLS